MAKGPVATARPVHLAGRGSGMWDGQSRPKVEHGVFPPIGKWISTRYVCIDKSVAITPSSSKSHCSEWINLQPSAIDGWQSHDPYYCSPLARVTPIFQERSCENLFCDWIVRGTQLAGGAPKIQLFRFIITFPLRLLCCGFLGIPMLQDFSA